MRCLADAVERVSKIHIEDLADWANCSAAQSKITLAFRVSRLETFLEAHSLKADISGAPIAPYRTSVLIDQPALCVIALERRGHIGQSMAAPTARVLRRAQIHRQMFRTRPREFKTGVGGLTTLARWAASATTELGATWTTALFFESELEFFLARCRNARAQDDLQQRSGVGWSSLRWIGYACSRETLHLTVALLNSLGLEPKETMLDRGYGRIKFEAPPGRGLADVFVFVDMADHDRVAWRNGRPMSPSPSLAAPGLWSALFGDSLLTGGPLAIGAWHSETSPRGDLLPVDPRRANVLEQHKLIGPDLAEQIRLHGHDGPRLLAKENSLLDVLSPETNRLTADAAAREQIKATRRRRRVKTMLAS